MSTYNSEKYLRQQVDSILAQEDVDIKLTIRDDGSNDATLGIIKEYAKQYPNISFYSDGENLRSAKSFLRLLKNADNADFYAFADHDDYWMPEKLKVATKALKDFNDVPALYFCQTQLVDKDLKEIPSVIINPRLTFGESLVYGFIGGCTMVMNKRLKDIVNTYSPEFIEMHDTWVYRIALAVGAKVVFDHNPHILYRQHGGNVIGQQNGLLFEWKARFKRFFNGKQVRQKTAEELKRGYWPMITEQNKQLLDLFINAKYDVRKRLKLFLSSDYKCAHTTTWIIFKAVLLINKY